MDVTSSAIERSPRSSPTENRESPHALGFSRYDRAAIAAWVRGDPDAVAALLEDTRALAEALAGPDGAGCRRRLLARAAAASRAQHRVLEELLARTVAARDFDGARIINKVLETTSQRLIAFVKQLACEDALSSRPSVVIGHANNVAVSAGRR